jgi:hypothetical protein
MGKAASGQGHRDADARLADLVLLAAADGEVGGDRA